MHILKSIKNTSLELSALKTTHLALGLTELLGYFYMILSTALP